ncbi:MAG: Beta-galactosidase, partial [Acidobacteria bacterium]|nr:Beta-galactosidase [Acidobacteriota bacterium]
WEQFKLPLQKPAPAMETAGFPELSVKDGPGTVVVTGKDFSLRLDKKDGVVTSYVFRGIPLLERGPRPDFWRAATDNDIGAWKAMREVIEKDPKRNINLWRNAGSLWNVAAVRVEKVDNSTARITVRAELPEVGASAALGYTIFGSGDIVVEIKYEPGKEQRAMMPRFGSEIVVAPGLENITWYGRGPVETYIDRQFERIGVYRSTVDREWVEYMRPQENGNKTDVRWVALTNAQGLGLLAVGAPTLSVAARHFSKDDMERAGYTFQMQPHAEIFLNLDWKQMGVGGIDSWSSNALPMEPYRIPSGQAYSYRYRLTPVQGDFSAKARERF